MFDYNGWEELKVLGDWVFSPLGGTHLIGQVMKLHEDGWVEVVFVPTSPREPPPHVFVGPPEALWKLNYAQLCAWGLNN